MTSQARLFSVRRWRLASGVVLFAYLLTHLVNHALGLIGLDAAEQGLETAKAFWRSWPATLMLYGSAALHFALALRTVFLRQDWRLPLVEIVRLAAGFSLPLLLIGHAVSTRLSHALFETQPRYRAIVSNLVANGWEGWQLALLAPGWLHGCLGLWISMSRIEALRRMKWPLIALAIGLPILAGLGFLSMAREIEALGLLRSAPGSNPAALARRLVLDDWRQWLTQGYLALVSSALVAGPLRRALIGRKD